jgi:hypothetical protein
MKLTQFGPSLLRRRGAGQISVVASIGPTGSFLLINRYFFVFVRSFETHAGAGVVSRWLSEIRSKADMNDAAGEVRLVPEAATIDDPAILDEVDRALKGKGVVA